MRKTENREDFISLLASMDATEINEYIKKYGKPPKTVRLYKLINNKEMTYEEFRSSKGSLGIGNNGA